MSYCSPKVVNDPSPLLFGPFYFVLLGVVTPIVFAARDPRLISALWRRPWANLLVALLMGIMLITHFLAIQQVEVAYMIAVKRTSLLFGILYGALVFGERELGSRLFAGALMVSGVLLIASSPVTQSADDNRLVDKAPRAKPTLVHPGRI